MPIGASGGRSKRGSSGRMHATSSRIRKSCRRSKPRSKTACRLTRHPRRLRRTRKKTTTRAVDRWLGAMSVLFEDARAKVNLTLRVLGRRADGYHDLASLVAFADCADRLTLEPGAELSLTTAGPRAPECGEVADNLVIKAARLLDERVPGLVLGRFSLDK